MKKSKIDSKLVWVIGGLLLLWLISTKQREQRYFQKNETDNWEKIINQLKPVYTPEECIKCPKKDRNYTIPKLVPSGVLITPEEAKQIIKESDKEMRDSELLGKDKVNYIHRKSKTRWIPKNDPIGRAVIKRSLKWIRENDGIHIPLRMLKKIQVVKYGPGNFYNPHHDACAMDPKTCKKFLKRGGERIRTIILGLNEGDKEYTGGFTSFPNLGVKYRLPKCGGLFFHTLDNQHKKIHPHALHGGDRIGDGTKWICNIWFREGKFN